MARGGSPVPVDGTQVDSKWCIASSERQEGFERLWATPTCPWVHTHHLTSHTSSHYLHQIRLGDIQLQVVHGEGEVQMNLTSIIITAHLSYGATATTLNSFGLRGTDLMRNCNFMCIVISMGCFKVPVFGIRKVCSLYRGCRSNNDMQAPEMTGLQSQPPSNHPQCMPLPDWSRQWS